MNISKLEGEYQIGPGTGRLLKGKYVYNAETGEVCDADDPTMVYGTFAYKPLADYRGVQFPLEFGSGSATQQMECMRIVNSEIITEIQKAENSGAFFCLPSQFNGAEYPSERSPVRIIEDYKWDNTGGPRGQIAVHPATGQFVLDNAASDLLPTGINAVDEILARTDELGVKLQNGYLSVPKNKSSDDQAKIIEMIRAHAHTLRPLVMKGSVACGLNPSKRGFAEARHRVNLVFASAVPVQSYMNRASSSETGFQVGVAEILATAQYYGTMVAAVEALKSDEIKLQRETPVALPGEAAGGGLPPPSVGSSTGSPSIGGSPPIGGAPLPGDSGATPSIPTSAAAPETARVFLMPLGGGVFNNPWESIARCMSAAVEMLTDDQKACLDICVLAWNGNPSEQQTLTQLLTRHNKLKAARGGGGSIGGGSIGGPPLPPP